jgi:HEAT repeat protein
MDGIAWGQLRHNYGAAADIPRWLRACGHQDARVASKAVFEVDNLLYHQGGWICSAAPAALPFLVELARGTAVHHRHEVVELIGRLAREAVIVQPRFLDARWQPALDAARPQLLALLDDPDPRVRREATLLVAGGIRHPEAVQALRQRWQVETDRVTRWDLVLAFGSAGRWQQDEGLRAELVRLLTHDDVQIRLAAVHALAEYDPAAAVAHVDTLVHAVLHDDSAIWRESAWIGGTPAAVVHSTGALLQADPVVATAYTIGVGRSGDTEQRVAAVDQAGRVLSEWRTVTGAILPFLGAHLEDPQPEVRYRAAGLLACLGTEATGYADQLAARAADPGLRDSRRQVTVGDAAVWALARQYDARCVPGLVDRLAGDRLGFDTVSGYYSSDMFILSQPGIHEVLIPLREYAGTLVDAVAARLTPGRADRFLTSNLCEVIAQWGPAAEAALPAIAPLLRRTDVAPAAARALGGIGPAAAPLAKKLRRQADEPNAAWALWRTGADPDLGRDRLIRHVTGHSGPHRAIRLLADVGPPALTCADRLRQLTRSDDDWLRVEAAHALWRIGGDPAEPVAVLTELARPLAEGGHCLPVGIAALRYLATIGTTDEPVVDIARAIVDNPRRIAASGGWRTFTEDEDLRAAAARILVH